MIKSRAAFIIGVSVAFSIFLYMVESPIQADEKEAVNEREKQTPTQQFPLELNVHLKQIYLDGVVSEETVTETVLALEDFWAKYESWQLVDMDEERLVFQKEIDDISPMLKMNGFLGMTEDGTLSIFNGKPDEDDVIQSFFQIDINKLESKQQLQLKYGIPIQSKEDFSHVYEVMKQYSIEHPQEG